MLSDGGRTAEAWPILISDQAIKKKKKALTWFYTDFIFVFQCVCAGGGGGGVGGRAGGGGGGGRSIKKKKKLCL